jgi:hypothetical protein
MILTIHKVGHDSISSVMRSVFGFLVDVWVQDLDAP